MPFVLDMLASDVWMLKAAAAQVRTRPHANENVVVVEVTLVG